MHSCMGWAWNGIGLIELSPTHNLQGTILNGNLWTISWMRRNEFIGIDLIVNLDESSWFYYIEYQYFESSCMFITEFSHRRQLLFRMNLHNWWIKHESHFGKKSYLCGWNKFLHRGILSKKPKYRALASLMIFSFIRKLFWMLLHFELYAIRILFT